MLRITLVIGGLLVSALSAAAQPVSPAGPAPATPGGAAPTPVLAPVSPGPASISRDDRLKALVSPPKSGAEYRLGPGDLIEVGVFGVDDYRHVVRINGAGMIKVPLIDPIMASGMTPGDLERALTELLARDVIKNPQVSVFVKEYRSQPVYVLGSVRTPGQYQITLPLRVVDAISMAGGLQPTAGDEATIQRVSAAGVEENIVVNLRELLEEGDLSRNVAVQGGDVVHVRERITETVYVIGEVNRGGAFYKPPKQELRVSQLIAWAGGPAKTANLSKGMLVRYKEGGEREELPVDFGDILKGKKEDFFVRANDVIFVPGSKFKNFGQTLLNGLPGTLASIPFYIVP